MTKRTRRPGRHAPTLAGVIGIVLGGTLAAGAPLRAQEPGALLGRVYDQRESRPLEGVSVVLQQTGDSTTTDRDGAFSFAGAPAGRVAVRLALEGYGSLVESVEIAPLEITLIRLELHRVDAVLDELLVLVGGAPEARGHAEGEIVEEGEGSLTAADLLMRRVPGLSAIRTSGAMGAGLRVRLRGTSSITLSDQPAIYLDGVRIDEGGDLDMRILDEIPATDVQRIRVLRGPAAASRYPLSAAGVILIETRRSGPPPPG